MCYDSFYSKKKKSDYFFLKEYIIFYIYRLLLLNNYATFNDIIKLYMSIYKKMHLLSKHFFFFEYTICHKKLVLNTHLYIKSFLNEYMYSLRDYICKNYLSLYNTQILYINSVIYTYYVLSNMYLSSRVKFFFINPIEYMFTFSGFEVLWYNIQMNIFFINCHIKKNKLFLNHEEVTMLDTSFFTNNLSYRHHFTFNLNLYYLKMIYIYTKKIMWRQFYCFLILLFF